MSGGGGGAEKGTLAVMVAGDPDLYDRHTALLSVIGRNVFHVGAEPGQGQAMKLANNLLSIAAVHFPTPPRVCAIDRSSAG